MFVACGIWCLADVSSVSPSSEQTVIKPADKGGAVVVWRTDLYKQEAFRQLADTKFYAKVNKDLTQANHF